MAECARCGDFTDNPAEDEYHYCDACLDDFEQVRKNGVVIKSLGSDTGYQVILPSSSGSRSGKESNQVDALARGKKIADELDVACLFEYSGSGSQWILDEYLQSNPKIRADVQDRLSRVPEPSSKGFFARLKNIIS